MQMGREGRAAMTPESEEELIYFTDENSLPLDENGIRKTTEFRLSDLGLMHGEIQSAQSAHVRLRPWERQGD